MDSVSLETVAEELLADARAARAGRASRTIHGGHEHALRQTVVALAAGQGLGEHDSPGEATLQVLRGRVELHAGDETWPGSAGDLVTIPPRRHSLSALTDSAVLLSVAVSVAPE